MAGPDRLGEPPEAYGTAAVGQLDGAAVPLTPIDSDKERRVTTLPTTDRPHNLDQSLSPSHIHKMTMGFFAARAIQAAVELDIFTVLANEPGTVEDVERRCGLHPRA